jgi:hypothetical protein
VVFCVDEKSQIQALERSQPLLSLGPGRAERRSHDYFRHGTLSLFAALNIKTGQVLSQCRARHTHREFIDFLKNIEAAIPTELSIHAVLDNDATHKTKPVQRWRARHPRWHLPLHPHSQFLG